MGWKKLFDEMNMPALWLPWLANADSMTQALEEASGVSCQVIVQKEGWQPAWEDESQLLCHAVTSALSACDDVKNQYWIREVIIATRRPVMFARSVFPRHLIERFPELTQLGSQPLGRIIFADGRFQRGPIEVAEISTEQPLWQHIPPNLRSEKCWARRSLFHSDVSSFLLSEVFFSHVATL